MPAEAKSGKFYPKPAFPRGSRDERFPNGPGLSSTGVISCCARRSVPTRQPMTDLRAPACLSCVGQGGIQHVAESRPWPRYSQLDSMHHAFYDALSGGRCKRTLPSVGLTKYAQPK